MCFSRKVWKLSWWLWGSVLRMQCVRLSVTGLGPWVYGLKFVKIPVRVLGKLCGDLGWGVKGSFLVLGTEYLVAWREGVG